jgi:hypothetical protein
MTHLVVGDNLSFLFINEAVFLLKPCNDSLNGLLKIGHSHLLPVVTNGQKGRLINKVCQIRPHKPGRQ